MIFIRSRYVCVTVGLFLGSVSVQASDASHWPALKELLERSALETVEISCSDEIVRPDADVEVATCRKLEKRWIKFSAQLESRTITSSDLLKELAVFVDYVAVATPTFAARILGHIIGYMNSLLDRLATKPIQLLEDDDELFEMLRKAIGAVSATYAGCVPTGLLCFARAVRKEHALPQRFAIKCREDLCRLGELLVRLAEKKLTWLKNLEKIGVRCSPTEKNWVLIHLGATQWLIAAKKSKGESATDLERLVRELKEFCFKIAGGGHCETSANRKRPRTALVV
ncbi:MAG: hypothetical protein QG632_435 [Candidatus Dependentiae bacterium]|nr:hypothetical protein [Candidatus Dependentiae bacterium]